MGAHAYVHMDTKSRSKGSVTSAAMGERCPVCRRALPTGLGGPLAEEQVSGIQVMRREENRQQQEGDVVRVLSRMSQPGACLWTEGVRQERADGDGAVCGGKKV